MYKWEYMQYTCVYFLALSAENLRINDTSVTMSTLSAQILIFNIILQKRELGVLGGITDSKNGTGNIQNKFAIRKCSRKKSTMVGYVKETQQPNERVP